MRIFERIEREIAFVFHGRVTAEISDQRVRELMQAQRKNPANQNNDEGQDIHFPPSNAAISFSITFTGKSMPCADKFF